MLSAGATLIDIGGESTRPGAKEVSEQEELDQVVPVVEALANRFDVWLSVDTSKAAVIAESARAGAHLINDIRSLQEPGALEAAALTGVTSMPNAYARATEKHAAITSLRRPTGRYKPVL